MPDANPRNLRNVREITRRDILFSVARVPNTSRLLVASSENKVLELDASQATPTAREYADHGRYATCVRLAGNTIISGGYDNRLIWWDLQNNRAIRTVDAHTRQLRQLAVSPDGTKLASVADDMVCRLWNVATGVRLRELRGHEERTPTHFGSMLYCCAFSNDGTKLATGDRVGRVVIWNVASGERLSTVEVPSLYTWDATQRIRSIGGIRALAFSPDGTQIAVGGVGQIGNVDGLSGPSRVEIHDWERRTRVHEFNGAQQGIYNRLVWHPDNHWLCAIGGGSNGFITFHKMSDRTMLHQANLPMHTHDSAFSEDWNTLYHVGHQKIVVQELRGWYNFIEPRAKYSLVARCRGWMGFVMNEALTVPSMDAEVNPLSQSLVELERRVLALEAKVASIPDQKHLETHITERIKATLPPPPPPVNPLQAPSFADITVPMPNMDTLVETAKSTWTILEMLGEFKALFWTLFDRRYHMAWMTRFIAIVLLAAIMTSDYWFPLATYPNTVSQLWDKFVNIVLCMILFMVLIFETRRYKEWRKGR